MIGNDVKLSGVKVGVVSNVVLMKIFSHTSLLKFIQT